MLTNYDVTAIIAACALVLSLAFWITLKKRWLPALKTDIIKEAPEIGKKTYDLIKKDLPDIKELFKEELPGVITALKAELPAILKAEAPKLVKPFLKDITNRITEGDEEINILLTTAAFQGMSAFRACMQDPDFKQEVDSFINGKMSKLGTYLEKRLPEILVKAAPEIRKAIMGGGGGKGGEQDPTLGLLGMFIPPEFRQAMGGGV